MNIELLRKAEIRSQIWKEYVATYQRVMIQTPEKFEEYSAEMRQRYLLATGS
jgi:hypothetical protein